MAGSEPVVLEVEDVGDRAGLAGRRRVVHARCRFSLRLTIFLPISITTGSKSWLLGLAHELILQELGCFELSDIAANMRDEANNISAEVLLARPRGCRETRKELLGDADRK